MKPDLNKRKQDLPIKTVRTSYPAAIDIVIHGSEDNPAVDGVFQTSLVMLNIGGINHITLNSDNDVELLDVVRTQDAYCLAMAELLADHISREIYLDLISAQSEDIRVYTRKSTDAALCTAKDKIFTNLTFGLDNALAKVKAVKHSKGKEYFTKLVLPSIDLQVGSPESVRVTCILNLFGFSLENAF